MERAEIDSMTNFLLEFISFEIFLQLNEAHKNRLLSRVEKMVLTFWSVLAKIHRLRLATAENLDLIGWFRNVANLKKLAVAIQIFFHPGCMLWMYCSTKLFQCPSNIPTGVQQFWWISNIESYFQIRTNWPPHSYPWIFEIT